MTKFMKPGHSESYDLMGAAATRDALSDAAIDFKDIQLAQVGFVLGDPGCAQQTIYQVGVTGIPITNVSNACATGATALYLAYQAIKSGMVDCVLALGFEQMQVGALGFSGYDDRPVVIGQHIKKLERFGIDLMQMSSPLFPVFDLAGEEYAKRYGLKSDTYARVTVKARQNAMNNPNAIFHELVTAEQVLASKNVYGSLTKLQCCPPTSGAAAAVLMSEDFARKRGANTSVELAAISLRSDGPSSFAGDSMIDLAGFDIARTGAQEVYETSGLGPEDIDVAEINDNFSCAEIITYDALGFCPEGGGEKFLLDGDSSHGGKIMVNPSGGMMGKGHPLGASGVAQCAELTWQLRGQADKRQVEGARIGLQQNLGFVSAGVVGLYKKHS